jgi:hypothetical protein
MRQAAQLDLLIRAGYCARNPLNGAFVRNLNSLDDRGAGALSMDGAPAVSMAVIGCSGLGKTTTVCRMLEAYKQVIKHDSPSFIRQIVWMRLDCPSGGSPKQLCISFFQEVDRLLGNTEYYSKFSGLSTDHMLSRVRHIASLHAIGLLVVDEVQNLALAPIGREQVLAFLTSLVNVANIPVLMIGTMRAYDVLTQNFRIARRGEGVGSIVYKPLEKGPEWDAFIKTLFKLQWTMTATTWTPELGEELWDQSQGVIDVVLKLYMLCQMRAIRLGVRTGAREEISVDLIRVVAEDSFELVRPMLDALRRKDWVALAKCDDLSSFDMCIAKQLAGSWGMDGAAPDLSALVDRIEAVVGFDAAAPDVKAALVASGLSLAQVRVVLAHIDDVKRASCAMSESSCAVENPSKPKRAQTKARSGKNGGAPVTEGDLRNLSGIEEDPVTALEKAGYLAQELPN